MRRLLPLLLVAAGIHAAPVRLGPEIALAPRVEGGPAAFRQSDPEVASNGRGFLAVWYDEREQATRGVYTTAVAGHLYVSALDAEGRPVERFGHRFALADGGEHRTHLASNGEDYLVQWTTDGVRYVQRLDANGDPAAAARRLDDGYVYHLLSNGSTYLAITSRVGGLFAVSLDRDGTVLGESALGLDDYPSFASAENGHYVVVGAPPGCAQTCAVWLLKTIDDHAGALTVTETKLAVAGPANAIVVIAPERLLFVSQGMNGIYELTGDVSIAAYDRATGALASQELLRLPPPLNNLGATWDGREFLITAYRYPGMLDVARVRAAGSLAPGQPVRLSNSASGIPVLATNGTTDLLLWRDLKLSSNGDLARRAVHDLGELATPAETFDVFESEHAQPEAAIAASPASTLSAWRDDTAQEIHAAIGGEELLVDRQPTHRLSNPSVAVAGNRILVAWYDATTEGPYPRTTASLFVRRYALDGTAIDAAPMRVGPEVVKYSLDDAPGVAVDGASFLLAYDSSGLTILRLEGEGDATGLVSRSDCPASDAQCWGSFPPAKIGAEWVVPYIRYYGFFSPHTTVTWTIDVLRTSFSASSTAYLSTPVTGDVFTVLHTGVANDGERLTFAKPQGNGIAIYQSTSPGPAELRYFLSEKEGAIGAALAWNGSEYVLAWTKTNGGPIRAIRLDRNAQPLDGEAFDVAPGGSTRSSPSLTVKEGNMIIGYSRITEAVRVPRAFMRTLYAINSIPRRPAVRH